MKPIFRQANQEVLVSRTGIAQLSFLAVFAVVLFGAPYFLPVRPVVSQAYVCGYNNHAAVLIFFLGSALFAMFTGGLLVPLDGGDRALSRKVLASALLIVFVLCLVRSLASPQGASGYEASFFLNRGQLLAAGHLPYREFDFPYGPLLLYPSFWVSRLLNISPARGYEISWTTQWLLGTAMLWAVVRAIEFPVRFRRAAFWLLLAIQFTYIRNGGVNYTPFRACTAAFLVFVCHWVIKRTDNAWLTSCVGIVSVGIAIACSLEQAFGVIVGVGAVLLIQSYRYKRLPWGAIMLFAGGIAACMVLAARSGMLISFHSFASGGYANPILPSPSILIAFFAYIAAACAVVYFWRIHRLDSLAIPLAVAGAAMMPTVLGRCDFVHLLGAMPAFIVGTLFISASPSLRSWWLPGALAGICLLPVVLSLRESWINHHPAALSPANQAQAASVIPARIDPDKLPCDHQYQGPSLIPEPLSTVHISCLDTGYFMGTQDVVTVDGIDLIVNHLRKNENSPLLLLNSPLEAQFADSQGQPAELRLSTGSLFTPPIRNAPLTYDPIIDYIRSHYTPGPLVPTENVRIWYPRIDAHPDPLLR